MKIRAKKGYFLTQKWVNKFQPRTFAVSVSGDVKAEDWIEVTAEEKVEMEKNKS
jgi:hypothetical protein